MNRVVVGIGSNIDPALNITKAKQKLGRKHRVIATSSFIETKPIGYLDQSHFVNGAILIDTEMGYEELRDWLRGLEKALGRIRGENKYGPRTIDLDIVVWNGKVVDEDVYERGFLIDSILEVCPDLRI